MSDGTLIFAPHAVISTTCSSSRGGTPALQSVCAEIWVDVNGLKKPNQYGKDMFIFYLTKNGFVPEGSQQETSNTFASACAMDGSRYGWACAAWVIYNENTDYTKCSGLDWGGQTKCN